MVSPHPRAEATPLSEQLPSRRWRRWWRELSPHRQDRFAALAPLAAVFLFFVAIAASLR